MDHLYRRMLRRNAKLNRFMPLRPMPLKLFLSALSLCGMAACATNTSAVYRPTTPEYPTLSAREKARSVVRNLPSANPLVENGISYEKVIVSVPQKIRTVVVPSSSRVIVSGSVNAIEIYLRKTLHWMGHPSEHTSIVTEGAEMGVAGKIQGPRLYLATFGDWVSFEGGSDISAVVVVPEHLKTIERRSLHYGDEESFERMQAFKKERWFILPSSPDPTRAFERLSKGGT